MCRSCWYNDHGAPVIADAEVLATAELIRRLYEDLGQPTGGPLHWMLDDMNIDDEQFERRRDGYPDDLYAHLWDGRFDAYTQAGEDTSHERKVAIEETCRLIWTSFERMPESHRAASIAWFRGWTWDHLQALVGTMGDTPPRVNQIELDAYIQELRTPATPAKGCNEPIPCPPFEEVTLHVTATSALDQMRQRATRHALADLAIRGETYLRRDTDGALGRAPEWQRIAWSKRYDTDPSLFAAVDGLPRLKWAEGWAEGQIDPDLLARLVDEPPAMPEHPGFTLAPGALDQIRQQYEGGTP